MVISRECQDQPAGGADNTPASRTIGLAAEHGQLLREVAVRAEAVLAVAADGRWPARELEALLGCLRSEIIRQVGNEELLLFPVHRAPPGLDRLAREHARLRAGIEALERATDSGGSPASPARATQDLLSLLEHLLDTEEATLAGPDGPDGPGSPPATTALGARPHEWYPLTEGPVIDLDALPPERAADAAAERLLRLRHGEDVELRSGRDPYLIWQRVDELAPRRYGFTYLEDGPDCWRVQVTRRVQA